MGKPERKVQERIGSSSSYFLRCFGIISRRIHSHKPIVEVGHEVIKIKRKTRPHWFLRPIKSRLRTSEIKPSPSNKTENESMNVEDNKQILYRVIRHATDRKFIAASGYTAVELENGAKDTTEQKDIKPDPLSLLGNDNKCGGKHDLNKTVGSGLKAQEVKKNSLRVRKESRVDPITGIFIILVTLLIMLVWGRLCAIFFCTSTWCYFLPRLKQTAVAKRKRSNSGQDEDGLLVGYLDLNSEAYKKKVVLEGFLDGQNRISL